MSGRIITGQRLVSHEYLARVIVARAVNTGMKMNVDPHAMYAAFTWVLRECKDDQEIIELSAAAKEILLNE